MVALLLILTSGNYYFTIEGCSSCQAQMPIIIQLQEEGYLIQIIHYETNPEMFKKFDVMSTPTFVVVKNYWSPKILKLKGMQHRETLIKAMSHPRIERKL